MPLKTLALLWRLPCNSHTRRTTPKLRQETEKLAFLGQNRIRIPVIRLRRGVKKYLILEVDADWGSPTLDNKDGAGIIKLFVGNK